jgi:hypothetical protein
VDLSGALAGVVAQLKAAGVEQTSTDPSQVTAPGVVVQLVGIGRITMTGYELDLNLLLVVADSDGGPGPAAALSSLLNLLLAWATPDGPITARSIQLPSGPAPLPGLVFPLTVRIDA